jgi:TRAP-type C4-dicarboxylate transport system substrate-binding protein
MRYAETVEKASGGKLKFRISGPEVVNAFEQFQPASNGAFDLLFTVQPYHLGTTAVSFGIYSMKPDPEGFRKSGIFEHLDKEYQRFNLKLLAIIPGSKPTTGAFHAIMRDPLGPDGDIKGKRVRGNPLFRPFIEKMGASMVVLQVGEIYSALQKGTIDGAFGPVTGTLDYKWHEVVKQGMRPTFGTIYQFLMINTASFGRLPPDQQKVVVDEAVKLEIPGMNAMDAVQNEEEEGLKKAGVVMHQFSKAKFDEALAAYNEGVWTSAETSKATGERSKAFRALAREKGFTK